MYLGETMHIFWVEKDGHFLRPRKPFSSHGAHGIFYPTQKHVEGRPVRYFVNFNIYMDLYPDSVCYPGNYCKNGQQMFN